MTGRTVLIEDELRQTRALYAALQEQRRDELERLRTTTLECDRLRAEIAANLALWREGAAKVKRNSSLDVMVRIEDFESKEPVTPLKRLLAGLLLRFARRAVRNSQWAQAQIFYQCIALLRPRVFLWKQVAHMLYKQELYEQATALFEKVLERTPNDPEVQFLMDRCKENLDR